MLDDDYRPIGAPEADPRPPAHPSRVRAFVYGMGLVGLIAESGKDPDRQRQRAPGRGPRGRG